MALRGSPSLRTALQQAAAAAQHSGWSIMALGCTPEFRETGLSDNSGYGYHPAIAGAEHFLDSEPRTASSPPID